MTPDQESVSSESRLTLLDRLKVSLGLFFVTGLLRLLVGTYRIRVVAGADQVERLVRERPPVILAGWHEGVLSAGTFLLRELIATGFPLTLLVSLSRDGELLARTASKLGLHVVRGSTSRGGLGGLRRLYRMLKREGLSVGISPDGPRGPARHAQLGALLLSQISGSPIVPLASSTSRSWRLGSWDRMVIPKPFAEISIAVGEPLHVPSAADSEELGRQSQLLATMLDGLEERARESS